MRALFIAVPILSLLIGCADPVPKVPPATASVTRTQPYTTTPGPPPVPEPAPAAQDTLPSGYTLTDTTNWGNMFEDGQRAVLRRGGVMIDTVDLTLFGVAVVGQDSLVFLPVRTDSVPLPTTVEPSYESFPTEYTLWTPSSRRELRHLLPFFNAFFSSPTIKRETVIHYWGLAPRNKTNAVYAMRYDFRTSRLDSLSLNREDSFATDYRYHLGLPQVHDNEVSFDGVVLDATTWRIIRQDPPPK